MLPLPKHDEYTFYNKGADYYGQPLCCRTCNQELFLLKNLLACCNIGYQACNHQCYRTQVYKIHIVPAQEVAKDNKDSANDEDDDSCDFDFACHNKYMCLDYILSAKKHIII